ncbi:MAG: SpoIIE family protein phosphatase [Candidatus Riflebacteria bacterium]|nr:SpoIIE family protein phosphatase [Candidatus Riflebacteria bacterium]
MIGDARRFLMFLLMVLVPAGFVVVGITQNQEERRVRRARRTLEATRDRLLRVAFRANPLVQMSRGAWDLASRLRAAGWRPVADSPLANGFPAGYPVQVAGFTPEGTLWQPDWGKVTSRFLWSQLWQDICRREIPARNLERYQSLFGGWLTGDDTRVEATFQEVSTPAGPGFFSFFRGPGKAGVMMFCPGLPTPLARWRELLVREPPRGLDVWVLDPRTGRLAGTAALPPAERELLRRARWDPAVESLSSRHCHVTRRTEDNLILLGRARIRPPARPVNLWPALVLIGLLVPVWWILVGGDPLARMGIQARLLVQFALVAALPVALVWQNGWNHLAETEQRLIEEAHEGNLVGLRAADAALGRMEERQERYFRALTAAVGRRRRSAAIPAAGRLLERARRANRISAYTLIDQAGRARASWWSDRDIGDLGEMFAAEMVRRYRDDTFLRPADTLAWTFFQFLQSTLIGFDTISDSRGIARPLEAGASTVWWFWDLFPRGTASDAAFLGLVKSTWDLQEEALHEGLPAGVQAFDLGSGQWFPRPPAFAAPDALLASAFLGRHHVRARRTAGGRSLLVSAFPSPVHPRVCFVTATDLAPVARRLDALRWSFLLAAAFTLVLAGFLARVISGTLLVPLGRLAEGVTAFGRGRRDLALPDLGPDEIGVMGEAFNGMVREAREVDAARQVQESLIPAVPRTVPGYQTALRYLPLEDLAGDFCDTLPRPDGSLFLAIGDVTGHGIGSALQTAMAKAVCAQACREGWALPATFDALNAVLHLGRASGKLMTFCGGILDPATHLWQWISAGHNFPVRRGPAGEADFLRHVGVPLGAKAARKWSVSERPLEPGTLLVFYTDGLVEATAPDGEPFGYDRLLEQVRLAPADPGAALDHLLQAFRGFVGGTPLNDDVTLLAVARNPAPDPASDPDPDPFPRSRPFP